MNLNSSSSGFLHPAIAFLAVVIFITCDKPFEPVEPKDYVLYGYNSSAYPFVYLGYHTKTNLLDTFTLPVEVASVGLSESPLAVSPDGQILYVATQSSNISLVDVKTKQIIQQLPFDAREVQASTDGKYLAIHGFRHQLWILETGNYSLVYFDSGWYSEGGFRRGRFAESNETYYCTDHFDATTGYNVYKINFTRDSVPESKLFSQKSVDFIIPSNDEAHWYLYLSLGNYYYEFAVYNVFADSIIFSDIFSPGSGYMEMSPDGRYVFYTYPGGMIGPPPTRRSLSVYDTYKNEIAKVIPGKFVNGVGDTSLYRPAELAVTPDGRNLISVQKDGVGRFLIINAKTLEVERYFESNNVEFIFLAIQGRP